MDQRQEVQRPYSAPKERGYHLKQLELIRKDITFNIDEANKLERWTMISIGLVIAFFFRETTSAGLRPEYILAFLFVPLYGIFKYVAIIKRNVALRDEAEAIEHRFSDLGIHIAFKREAHREARSFRQIHRYGVYLLEAGCLIGVYLTLVLSGAKPS